MTATGGILGAIVERTLADVEARLRRVSHAGLEEAARTRARTRLPLARVLRRESEDAGARFLCEVKKASPSGGVLAADIDPAALAAAYLEHGAAAVSVVTEPHFFGGEESFLDAVRSSAPSTPILRKDFHVHELQVFETAAGPADALLLLASVLSPTQLRDYIDIADAFALDHLVEVTDTREAEDALRAGARTVGVNNRDLATFRVDLGRTEAVLPALRGSGAVAVAESGISTRDAVVRLTEAGVDAFLVGEALITAVDPGAKLRELRGLA